jgi:hypothetical protein
VAGSGDDGYADGVGGFARFNTPKAVAVLPAGAGGSGAGRRWVVLDTDNHRLRAVDAASGAVTTLAGSGADSDADGALAQASFESMNGVAVHPISGVLYVTTPNGIRTVDLKAGACVACR